MEASSRRLLVLRLVLGRAESAEDSSRREARAVEVWEGDWEGEGVAAK